MWEVFKVKIKRVARENYYGKKVAKKHNVSYMVGKYGYIIDNRYSLVRIIPLKPSGIKNSILRESSKLIPYYELMINQDNTPKFWHISDALKYLQDYFDGKVELFEDDCSWSVKGVKEKCNGLEYIIIGRAKFKDIGV